ncbi:MAG: chaperonin 10-like protein [Monoraphidium minutum]|nr:MAG: chaperonin 10-like protein [Monoraphidium minutum]
MTSIQRVGVTGGRAAAAARRPAMRCAAALTKFKGFAVQQPHEKFQLFEYEPKPLGPKDIEIKVTHNGLCHTDIHMRDNDWGATTYPLIPGHEVVGVVAAKGAEVAGFKEGDRVGVGWIKDSCRCCMQCMRGNENLCEAGYTGLIVGANNFGGFQPLMRTPADFAYKIPDGMGSAEAAPLLCAGITVYAPLRKFLRHPDMRVAVLGVGGLGHLGVQFAAAMGAEVTALARQADKSKEAKALRADEFMTTDDALAQRKNYFDIILNTASGAVDSSAVLAMLRADGVLIQCGIPGGGARIDVPLQDIVFNQKAVAGSVVGGRADMQEMFNFAAKKGIKPMIELYKLSDINAAIDRVASGKARYRVVMETDA